MTVKSIDDFCVPECRFFFCFIHYNYSWMSLHLKYSFNVPTTSIYIIVLGHLLNMWYKLAYAYNYDGLFAMIHIFVCQGFLLTTSGLYEYPE